MPAFLFYDMSDMGSSNGGILVDGPNAAGLTTYSGQSFNWDPARSATPASTVIEFNNDADGELGNGPDSTGQSLAAALQGDGKTWAAGQGVFASYSYSFRAPDGSTQRLIAIQQDGSNNVIGYVSTYPLSAGTNYSIISPASNSPTVNYCALATCFSADALIETDRGLVRARDLQVGDLVETRDAGLQPIRWVGAREVSPVELALTPKLRPIRIKAGALGDNVPSTDLVVSPQHRVLVCSKIAQRMFGTNEVLIAAKQLCQIDGIDVAEDMDSVTYVHFLFDEHQIVISNGAETESLHTGPGAMRSLAPASVEEILSLFPELRDGVERPGARQFASGRMGRKLAIRHIQNQRALVS